MQLGHFSSTSGRLPFDVGPKLDVYICTNTGIKSTYFVDIIPGDVTVLYVVMVAIMLEQSDQFYLVFCFQDGDSLLRIVSYQLTVKYKTGYKVILSENGLRWSYPKLVFYVIGTINLHSSVHKSDVVFQQFKISI